MVKIDLFEVDHVRILVSSSESISGLTLILYTVDLVSQLNLR